MNTHIGYAPVDGLRLYYEIHGSPHSEQPPLVLLHGGGDTITTSFGHLLPVLARDRLVIAFEQQGFGHTADIADRPFRFEQSADDTVALLEYLKVPQADLFGFSNGGTIALQVAIRHPQIARKLIVASGFFNHDGADPAFWNGFPHATLEHMPKELRDAYLAAAPHPENLQSFFNKCVERMQSFEDIPAETIRSIAAPTIGDCGRRRRDAPGARGRHLPAAAVRATCCAAGHRAHGAHETCCVVGANDRGVSECRDAEDGVSGARLCCLPCLTFIRITAFPTRPSRAARQA